MLRLSGWLKFSINGVYYARGFGVLGVWGAWSWIVVLIWILCESSLLLRLADSVLTSLSGFSRVLQIYSALVLKFLLSFHCCLDFGDTDLGSGL